MDHALVSLIAANVTFAGLHFALSHPLRAPLVKRLGEQGFLGLYSLLSIAAFVWVVIAFRAVGPSGAPVWQATQDAGWIVASVLTVLALTLAIAALKGNPAAVGMNADMARTAQPSGVYAVTRHPLMWGVAIWALAHTIIMPTPRTLVTASAMAVLALVGAHLQDRKKAALLGPAWGEWKAKTHFVPRLGKLGQIRAGTWASAVVLWLAITWLHGWLGTPTAGVWRWVS